MKKILYIEDLEVYASIGVYDNEKNRKQKLVFNIKLYLSLNILIQFEYTKFSLVLLRES